MNQVPKVLSGPGPHPDREEFLVGQPLQGENLETPSHVSRSPSLGPVPASALALAPRSVQRHDSASPTESARASGVDPGRPTASPEPASRASRRRTDRFSDSPPKQRSRVLDWRVVATWLPFGGTGEGVSGLADTGKAGEFRFALTSHGGNTLSTRFTPHCRRTRESWAHASERWWLQRDSNPCFSLERADRSVARTP
jgi:hypothetical protein